MTASVSPPSAPPAPTLSELFLAFAKISVSGFGGALPWTRRMMVEEKRWMTADEFNEAFALCQFLPGPNVVNLAIIFGSRFHGVTGACVVLLGFLGPSVAIVTVLAALYVRYGQHDGVERILAGVAPAAAGLVVAVAIRMAEPILRRRQAVPVLIAAVTFVAIAVLRLPLQWVVLGLAPVSIAIAWWVRR